MTIYAKIITLAAVLVALAVGAQAQTPAIDALRARAEQGDADAQFVLGNGYATGRGVPQDYAEATRWYRLAAAQGNARAQYNLGGMYDQGRGVPQDDAEAVRWYLRAAAQGNAVAQVNLGLMYANGHGVPQDDVPHRARFVLRVDDAVNLHLHTVAVRDRHELALQEEPRCRVRDLQRGDLTLGKSGRGSNLRIDSHAEQASQFLVWLTDDLVARVRELMQCTHDASVLLENR